METNILIKNASLVTPEEIITDGYIKIVEGKISEIGKMDALKSDGSFKLIDAEKNYVCPGFFDIHVNGGGGSMVIDGDKEGLKKMLQAHVSRGVTTILPTTICVSDGQLIKALKNVSELMNEDPVGSIIYGIHLEGPFLNPSKRGAHQKEYLKKPSIDFFQYLNDISGGAIKILSFAPELEGGLDLISYAVEKGIVVGFAHSEADYQTTIKAIDKGMTLSTHLFNAMNPLSHKDPGPIGAFLTDDSTYIELISDGEHVHPAVMEIIARTKPKDKIILVTDAVSPAGTNIKAFNLLGHNLEVKGNTCYVTGTNQLAGSSLTMNVAAKQMYDLTSATLTEVIKMASTVPATLLGVDKIKGKLSKGYDADIIVISEDFNVNISIVGGKVLFDRKKMGNEI